MVMRSPHFHNLDLIYCVLSPIDGSLFLAFTIAAGQG